MPHFAPHKTDTIDRPWDGPLMKGRAKSGQPHSYYGKIFAWYDPQGDPGIKGTYKFVHHEVSDSGEPGAANIRGCIAGIAVLNGARGGTNIPDSDRRGVYNHFKSHLQDANYENIPELKSLEDGRETRNLKLSELRVLREEGQAPRISGYAAVFDTPSEVLFGFFREIIRPGAFANSLKEGDVRALWQHDAARVLGRTKNSTLILAEDSHGLKIDITPPKTQWAQDALESIRRGDVDQMSFGFQALKDNWTKDENGFQLRELLEVEVFEVSAVTFPAYPDTTVAVRSREEKPEEAPKQPEAWRTACRQREIQIGGAIL